MNSALQTLYNYDTLSEILFQHAKDIGSKRAVTIGSDNKQTHFTYADLVQRGSRAAVLIHQLTIPGDRVILALPTSPEFIEYFFGCILSGRIAVPLPVEKATSRFSRLKGVIQNCAPELIIFRNRSDYEKMHDSVGDCEVLILDEQSNIVTPAMVLPKNSVSKRHIAFIQYTSGSTSSPKGVALTHENIVANLRMIQKSMQLSSEERVVSWLPLHHDMGLIGMLLSLVSIGAYTHIYSYQEFARDPVSWLRAISDTQATLSGAPTFAFDLIGKKVGKDVVQNLDLSNVRLIYCGSERISQPTSEKFYEVLAASGLSSKTFFPCYGLAEASLLVAGKFSEPSQLCGPSHQYPSCGEIAEGLSLRIVNPEGVSQKDGNVGLIEIKGPSVSAGYWFDLKKSVSAGLLADSTGQWVNTGDVGYTSGSEVFVTGRMKDILKVQGRTIYPEDLEGSIEIMSEWFPSNGVVVVTSTDGKIIVMAEVLRNKRGKSFDGLLGQIQVTLGEHNLRCDRLVILSPLSMPKTSSGKKQRQLTLRALNDGDLKIIWDSDSGLGQTNSSKQVSKLGSSRLNEIRKYFSSINLDLADERRSFPGDFLLQMKNFKLLGLLIPKELGGESLNHPQFLEIAKSLGELDLSLASIIGIQNTIGTLPILHSSHLKDRENVLRKIAEGSIAAFALTEPMAGSNPRAMQTTAKAVGSKILLNGEKIWIGNAPFAQFITVFAQEIDSSGANIGISAFLLKNGIHKYRVGEEQLTVGVRAMPQCRVYLENVEVTDADRLTAPGEGMALAFLAMEYGRFGLAGVAVGALKQVQAKASAYADDRQIWTGRLGENEYFKFRMREVQAQCQALEALVDYSATQFGQDGRLPQALSLSCKILAGEWGFSGIDTSLQFTGGRGYTETFGIARFWRDIRLLRIFEGPTEAVAYQLGASIVRQSPNLSNIFGIDHKFSEIIRELSAECDTQLSKECFYVLIGKYSAQYLAYSILAKTNAGGNVQSVVQKIRNNLLEDVRSEMRKATEFVKLNNDQPKSSKSIEPRSLFDDWNGQQISKIIPSEVRGSDMSQNNLSAMAVGSSQPTFVPSKSFQPKVAEDLNEEDVQMILNQWLKSHIRVGKVDYSKSLSEYGVDSLLAYELLCFVEETFNVSLNESVIQQRPSIDQLCKIIIQKEKI